MFFAFFKRVRFGGNCLRSQSSVGHSRGRPEKKLLLGLHRHHAPSSLEDRLDFSPRRCKSFPAGKGTGPAPPPAEPPRSGCDFSFRALVRGVQSQRHRSDVGPPCGRGTFGGTSRGLLRLRAGATPLRTCVLGTALPRDGLAYGHGRAESLCWRLRNDPAARVRRLGDYRVAGRPVVLARRRVFRNRVPSCGRRASSDAGSPRESLGSACEHGHGGPRGGHFPSGATLDPREACRARTSALCHY